MRNVDRIWLGCVAAAAVCPITVASADGGTPASPEVVRGMTISCQGWGWEWSTDDMVEAMQELKSLGVTWITIHPYAGIRDDGRVVLPQRWYDDTIWLTRPIAEAHKLGLKIMIKPHLAYWGSSFSWRGAIAFSDEQQWQRFFGEYKDWILKLVHICRDADAFVVGTELDRTIHRADEWRAIIGAVRQRTSMPLTYAVNWDKYERVPFWDALDVIGIQSYFPMVEHDRLPTAAELTSSWQRLLGRLEKFARLHNRKIVLCELGYNRSAAAARRPWEHSNGGRDSEEVQRRCLSAALEAVDRSQTVVGVFLWKWFPGIARHENFLLSTPAMREVIHHAWGGNSPLPPRPDRVTVPSPPRGALDMPAGACPALASQVSGQE